jgi:hypothetical protein
MVKPIIIHPISKKIICNNNNVVWEKRYSNLEVPMTEWKMITIVLLY